MSAFRLLLGAILVGVVGYTIPVINNHGMGLLQIFFGDIAKMEWPGQFNVDFLGMLLLSGTWIAWRNHFSPLGIGMGALGVFGGAPILTAYLLYTSFQAKGDVKEMLLGKARASS